MQHIAFSCPSFRARFGGWKSCERKEEKVKAFVSSFVMLTLMSLSVTISCDYTFREVIFPLHVQMFMYIHSAQVLCVACAPSPRQAGVAVTRVLCKREPARVDDSGEYKVARACHSRRRGAPPAGQMGEEGWPSFPSCHGGQAWSRDEGEGRWFYLVHRRLTGLQNPICLANFLQPYCLIGSFPSSSFALLFSPLIFLAVSHFFYS